MKVRVILNGRRAEVEAATVAGLLAELGHSGDPAGIAVAVNRELIPRSLWPDTRLRDEDRVEIIGAVQGG